MARAGATQPGRGRNLVPGPEGRRPASFSGAPEQPFFFLALGNDGRSDADPGLGDAIHVIGVNPATLQATIINVPRDTQAPAGDKINAYHSLKGLPGIIGQLNQMMGIQINYAITTNFPGFIAMVDEVGGIDVNIPMALDDKDSGAVFSPGVQHLTGDQMLRFSRDRKDYPVEGDRARTGNQALEIISALAALRAQNPGAVGTAHLVAVLARHIRMENVGLAELFRLGRLALAIDPANVKNVTIPTGAGSGTNLSVGAGCRVAVRRLPRRRRPRDPLTRSSARRDPTTVATLDALTTRDPRLADRLAFRTTIPERPARHAPPVEPLHPEVAARLAARGVGGLYTHQVRAIDALRHGRHVVLATGTASGKSLGYQVPIVESALRGEPATALLVFPTKALAQDQLRSLREWLVPSVVAATYDGDTSTEDRARVRRTATAILTNPEMLHLGILPTHDRWATFLMRLRYVVVDELHSLRGIFGSHVAHVLRRLRRVSAHYGSEPTFCFASATIGNPAQLAEALCGLPVEAIDDDGSPQASRAFACWQRPFLDERSGTRSSANVETADLVARFVGNGQQTLAFTRSRKGSELVAAQARRMLAERSGSVTGVPASPCTGPGTSRRNGASSSTRSRPGSWPGSSRRARSSSASTSAASTRSS